MSSLSRRGFLASFALVPIPERLARAAAWRGEPTPHPAPRPGITGAKVLTREQLADTPRLIAVFDGGRAIPQVVDGIRCNCGVVTCDDTARTMKAQYEPHDEYFKRFAMIRVAPDWFVPGVYDEDGKIYEVYRPEMVFQFKRAGARAVSFDLRNQDDSVEFHATRKP